MLRKFLSFLNTDRAATEAKRSALRTYKIVKAFFNILAITFLFLARPVAAQQHFEPLCYSLDLRYPAYAVSASVPIPVSVEVVGAKEYLGPELANRLSYEWTLTQGILISGQGTSSILVAPAKPDGVSEITLTLKLIGGEPACESKKSFSIKVDADCLVSNKIDEYGDIPFTEETLHLDAVARELPPTNVVYILAYGGQDSCMWNEAKSRAMRAKKYLIERHAINADRIVIADNGYREDFTIELYTGSRGSCAPLPSATVLRSAVKPRGFCREKYKNRGEQIEN